MPKPLGIPFVVKDSALIQLATGIRAQNVRELRDRIMVVPAACIDYHFWSGPLRPEFTDPEYGNDFASWAHHGLHDDKLAEQLACIDPAHSDDIEALRHELLDVLERRIDEGEYLTWAKPDQQFHFLSPQLVVFDTGKRIESPGDLAAAIGAMSTGSIYFHFVQARRRPPRCVDDFRAWLEPLGPEYEAVSRALANVDPFFTTLAGLRDELKHRLADHLPVAA
ncbi:MAG TPA: DUF5752 family protein [Vicinamibacterales bacterium]|nr:DUF5752 family protein [Vicinamibacterales bacterium]